MSGVYVIDLTPPQDTKPENAELSIASRPGVFNVNIRDKERAFGTHPGPQVNREYDFNLQQMKDDTVFKIVRDRQVIDTVSVKQIKEAEAKRVSFLDYLAALGKRPDLRFEEFRQDARAMIFNPLNNNGLLNDVLKSVGGRLKKMGLNFGLPTPSDAPLSMVPVTDDPPVQYIAGVDVKKGAKGSQL